MLLVCLRAGSDEYVARLGLSGDGVALRVDRLLTATRMGSRGAAGALWACLRAEWERGGWSPDDPLWAAVLRHLAGLAAGTTVEPCRPPVGHALPAAHRRVASSWRLQAKDAQRSGCVLPSKGGGAGQHGIAGRKAAQQPGDEYRLSSD